MSAVKSIAPEHVYLLLWKAFYAVEAHDRRSILSLGFPNDSDFAVLEVLQAKGPLPVNEIGRRMFLTSGSITTAVDRAEERGLVRRTPCPRDRRVVYVELTERGRALVGRVLPEHFRNLAVALSGLSPEEQSTLAGLLRKLGLHAAALTAQDAGHASGPRSAH